MEELAELVARDLFRMLGVPLAAVIIGSFVRAAIRRIRDGEVRMVDFNVWVELMVASAILLFAEASIAAGQVTSALASGRVVAGSAAVETFYDYIVWSLVLIPIMMGVAAGVVMWVATPPTPFGKTSRFLRYLIPHVVAIAVLAGVFVFRSEFDLPIELVTEFGEK